MGAISRYFYNLARYMPGVLFNDTDSEVTRTLEALSGLRGNMLDKAAKIYDHKRTFEMAYFASLAYRCKDEDDVGKCIQGNHEALLKKYSWLTAIRNPDLVADYVDDPYPRGFIAGSGAEVVISVKGSSDTFDWLVNSKFLSKTSLIAHEGYAAMGAWVLATLLEALPLKRITEKKSIVFTGHSLGGATALNAAWMLAKVASKATGHHPKIEVFTFGRPQVEGASKTKNPLAFDVPEYRFAMAGDLVAGFGILDDESPSLLISVAGDIYYFDNSREAKLVRLFELIRAARGKKGVNDMQLRLLLRRVREAITDAIPIEADVMLSTEPMNFPPSVYLQAHKIDNYLESIASGAGGTL